MLKTPNYARNMPQNECPFCNSNNKISVISESDNFCCLYNIAPIVPGHVLVISKAHKERFFELSDAEIGEMMVFSRNMAKKLGSIFHTHSFDYTLQDGEAAGQTVPHLHLHIIPRHIGDFPDPGDWYPKLEQNKSKIIDSFRRPKLTEKEMIDIVRELRSKLEEG